MKISVQGALGVSRPGRPPPQKATAARPAATQEELDNYAAEVAAFDKQASLYFGAPGQTDTSHATCIKYRTDGKNEVLCTPHALAALACIVHVKSNDVCELTLMQLAMLDCKVREIA